MQTLFQLRPQAIDLSETETAFRAHGPDIIWSRRNRTAAQAGSSNTYLCVRFATRWDLVWGLAMSLAREWALLLVDIIYRRGLATAGSAFEPSIGFRAHFAHAPELKRADLFGPTVGVAFPYVFGMALDLGASPGLLIRTRGDDNLTFGVRSIVAFYYDPTVGGGDNWLLVGIEGGPLIAATGPTLESVDIQLRGLARF